jgi:FixJ family two-component response regulator
MKSLGVRLRVDAAESNRFVADSRGSNAADERDKHRAGSSPVDSGLAAAFSALWPARQRRWCGEPSVGADLSHHAIDPGIIDCGVRNEHSVGLDVQCFTAPRELMEAALPDRPGCLVLDVRMPGSSGLDLQQQLVARGDDRPIIFLTGYGDVTMSVGAMKAGAVDFLEKPARAEALLSAIWTAIERDRARRSQDRAVKAQQERLSKLSQRERQVFREVVRGRLNKQIAFDLGISEVTVKLHRGNVMRKMQAASVGDLVRAWNSLPLEASAA